MDYSLGAAIRPVTRPIFLCALRWIALAAMVEFYAA